MEKSERLNQLADICQFVYVDLGLRGIQKSCIQGSALLLKVLHGVGFPDAYPLAVGVTVCNDAFLEFSKTNKPAFDEEGMRRFEEAGCLMMNVGYGGLTLLGEEGWDGHLVVVVPRISGERHIMVDLTIVQLDRPELGARMNPLLLGIGDAFVNGESPSQFNQNGLLIMYEARPNDRSYRDDGDLFAIEGIERAAVNVIQNLARVGLVN
jgi:hypothetical protein